MDGSAVPEINTLPSCHAISKTPRAAGYRVSDFVLWHFATVRGTAAFRQNVEEEQTKTERR